MEWLLEQEAVDGNFSNKIFSSVEAHFTLSGYINKQNCRIWCSENNQIIEERSLHPEKDTVWCALSSEGVIGPFFFECDYETTLTVTVSSIFHTYIHNWPLQQFS